MEHFHIYKNGATFSGNVGCHFVTGVQRQSLFSKNYSLINCDTFLQGILNFTVSVFEVLKGS